MIVMDKSGNVSGSAALRCARNVVQRPGVGRGRQLDRRDRARRPVSAPTVRGPHHAAQRRKPLRVEKAGGDAVGGDHQVLDQLLRAIRHLRLDIAQPVAVEDVLDFQRLKLQRAVLVTPPAECLSDAVLHSQLLVHPPHGRRRWRQRSRPSQPGADGVVGELRVIPDDGAVHLRARQLAFRRSRRIRSRPPDDPAEG